MEKLKCEIEHIVFQNPDNGYSVFQVSVDGSFDYKTVVGTFQGVSVGATIVCEGEWKNNSKFGRQFVVETWFEELPSTIKGIESYLASGIIKGIGRKTAHIIVKHFGKDTLSILDNAPERLIEVNGIGKERAERIKKSWDKQKAVREVMIFLQGHGVSPTYAVKIYKQYGDDSIEVVKENPYTLADDVFGIGFKLADKIAESFGYEKTDVRRCKAGILYTLTQLANDGHCYAERGQLLNAAKTLLEIEEEPIRDGLSYLTFENSIIEDEDEDYFFLPMYYYSEIGVAGRLNKLLKNNEKKEPNIDIAALQEKTKIEYDEVQIDAIRMSANAKFMVLTGCPGCVDCNTEYFNGEKWVKISEYKEGDKVLQYNMDGTAELVKPLAYIKQPCDHMTLIKSKYGVNQCVCDDHRLVYETERGTFRISTTTEVRAMHQASGNGFRGRFYTTFSYGGKGIDLTDNEIRLMCAIVCDGTFCSKKEYNHICRINIKKQRKKERLEKILKDMDAVYEKKQYNPKDLEFISFYVDAPRKEKSFGAYWYQCNQHQLEVFCDEICRWDGCIRGKRQSFFTTIKETADFVQFAFSATGRRARVLVNDRTGQRYETCGKTYVRKSIGYEINVSNVTKISVHNKKTKDNIRDTIAEDGYKYCFTVPSSMLVLRRDGCINITGNCGKTTTVLGIISALESMGKEVLLAAPTGRAAKRMSEATDREAKTIHRLLEYKPDEGFTRNESNPLRGDVLVVDESSMIDILLMNSLMKAIPEKMGLILVGDIDQLPSVGAGNVLRDIIDSGVVPVVRLTRIFRQALTSRIVTNAHKINKGESPDISNGKDTDFFFIKQENADIAANDIVNIVKTRIPNAYGYGINDIQVLTPMKNGSVGTNNLNMCLQAAINPEGDFIQYGQTKYRKGDKVMQIKNDYDKNVFNGDVGYISNIDTDMRTMSIIFDKQEVLYESEDFNELTLAYATTIHKSQGSEYPVVVVPLTMSHFIMLQRNLIYTAVTRAKKLCIIIGDNRALGYAVKNFVALKRNTMLKERLVNNVNADKISA